MRVELREFVPKANYRTPSQPVQDLIAFGEETYNKYKDSGYLLMKFDTTSEGKGFIVYEIKKTVNIIEIYIETKEEKVRPNVIESLIYCVRNLAASLKKTLVIDEPDQEIKTFIKERNIQMKESNVEDKYKWTTIQ